MKGYSVGVSGEGGDNSGREKGMVKEERVDGGGGDNGEKNGFQ